MAPSDPSPHSECSPVVVPRSEHGISRKQIDEETLKVMYRLHRHGFKAYLVGGGVRDLLLGRRPKDFDVGTDATPDQVKKLFRNCFLVGRRFRLAHVRFGRDKVVEVATFRRKPAVGEMPADPEDHFRFQENVFGSPCEDAFRRDFTINALFYDIENFSLIDYVGGLEDLAARRLRVIGEPLERFTEDPVRMLRALEFCARLDFQLDEQAREGIYRAAPLIAEAAPARIREELMELFRHGVAGAVLRSAAGMGLLEPLLAGFAGDDPTFALLERIDAGTRAGATPAEPFALAALYLSRFLRVCPPNREAPVTEVVRLAGLVLAPHCGYFSIARAISHQARELLVGVYRLTRGRGRRGERRLLTNPMTPYALELLSFWSEATGEFRPLVGQWRAALGAKEQPGTAPLKAAPAKRRRRPRRRKPRSGQAPT
ncbi:polynucleotide adenylyltransferase PcnB [Geoalkalibacter halelectricus]|uniref:Poly(A) polymerase I n=1 Tax=Geoalkalibacter halelectricus TaxID=2847045 RepID=A0ABY5ZFG0_9BACT|nr:polynucleotide adenylyltransferase PcnB [Geoalkalibacter halelectricus]MDO3377907.1 polynucleotide adenylyltransferase PcnB [Geoalkalibacter halelectricus]UWZ77912.1 polynucleotide adenylyltransferase PcnB [Geoalkalibacter halelectricus]